MHLILFFQFPMKKSTKKRSFSKRGCMSTFLSPSCQQHEQLTEVKVAQHNIQKHQEGMEQEQHHQQHHQQLSVQQPLLQQPMQQQGMQPQQPKKMNTKFCPPGALSDYRDLRKKQMQRKDPVNEINNANELIFSSEHQPSPTNANEVGCTVDDIEPIHEEHTEQEAEENRIVVQGLICNTTYFFKKIIIVLQF